MGRSTGHLYLIVILSPIDDLHIRLFGKIVVHPDIEVVKGRHQQGSFGLPQDARHPQQEKPEDVHGIGRESKNTLLNHGHVPVVPRIEMVDPKSAVEPKIFPYRIHQI